MLVHVCAYTHRDTHTQHLLSTVLSFHVRTIVDISDKKFLNIFVEITAFSSTAFFSVLSRSVEVISSEEMKAAGKCER